MMPINRIIMVAGFVAVFSGCDSVGQTCYDQSLPEDKQKDNVSPHESLEAGLSQGEAKKVQEIAEEIAATTKFPYLSRETHASFRNPKELYTFRFDIVRRKDLNALCPTNGVLTVDNKFQPSKLRISSYNPDLVGRERLEALTDELVRRLEDEVGLEVTEADRSDYE